MPHALFKSDAVVSRARPRAAIFPSHWLTTASIGMWHSCCKKCWALLLQTVQITDCAHPERHPCYESCCVHGCSPCAQTRLCLPDFSLYSSPFCAPLWSRKGLSLLLRGILCYLGSRTGLLYHPESRRDFSGIIFLSFIFVFLVFVLTSTS